MSGDERYNVGQILYVIPNDKPLVIPVCILEKRTSETLEGVITRYIVKSPKPDAAPVDLASIKGAMYTSLDDVKRIMLDNSKRAIEEMISRADKSAQRAFGGRRALPEPQVLQDDDVDPLGDMLEDEVPRQPPPPTPQPRVSNGASSGGALVEVRGPDGQLRKVQLKQ